MKERDREGVRERESVSEGARERKVERERESMGVLSQQKNPHSFGLCLSLLLCLGFPIHCVDGHAQPGSPRDVPHVNVKHNVLIPAPDTHGFAWRQ